MDDAYHHTTADTAYKGSRHSVEREGESLQASLKSSRTDRSGLGSPAEECPHEGENNPERHPEEQSI